jgi:hypothetical protein
MINSAVLVKPKLLGFVKNPAVKPVLAGVELVGQYDNR